jgi:hypothetical protein
MRRPLPTLLALLSMLTQVALGVTAPLGLVFCVGESHAAVELAADDCCASHGSVVPTTVPTIERACCSDIPLYAAPRPFADGSRGSQGQGGPLAPATSVGLVPLAAGGSAPALQPARFASPPVGRSVVLRV